MLNSPMMTILVTSADPTTANSALTSAVAPMNTSTNGGALQPSLPPAMQPTMPMQPMQPMQPVANVYPPVAQGIMMGTTVC